MNKLYLKIDQTEVVYFGNTWSKVGGLACQLLTFMFDLYINCFSLVFVVVVVEEIADFVYLQNILIQNLGHLTKLLCT